MKPLLCLPEKKKKNIPVRFLKARPRLALSQPAMLMRIHLGPIVNHHQTSFHVAFALTDCDTLYYINMQAQTTDTFERSRFVVFQGTDTSVLQHQGPLLTSGAVIGIVVATIFIVFIIIDAIFCCVRKTGEPALNHSPNRFSLPLCIIQREHTCTCI